jgi:hypothetical protein
MMTTCIIARKSKSLVPASCTPHRGQAIGHKVLLAKEQCHALLMYTIVVLPNAPPQEIMHLAGGKYSKVSHVTPIGIGALAPSSKLVLVKQHCAAGCLLPIFETSWSSCSTCPCQPMMADGRLGYQCRRCQAMKVQRWDGCFFLYWQDFHSNWMSWSCDYFESWTGYDWITSRGAVTIIIGQFCGKEVLLYFSLGSLLQAIAAVNLQLGLSMKLVE